MDYINRFCIIIPFPAIVFIGAGGYITSKFSKKVCTLLGHISYPIYKIHYPLIYTYMAWVINNKVKMQDGLLMGELLFITSIMIAFAYRKLYDEPVRIWLKNKYLMKQLEQI